MKPTYNKSIPNIILNGERLKAFPQRLGIKQEYLPSPLLFSIVLKLARARKKKVNGIRIGKKEVKLSLFADDMIIHILETPSRNC